MARANKGGTSWWWAVGLILLGLPLIYWSQASAEPEELAGRRDRIRKMSEMEREKLNRNFERFQQLSPEKQQSLREIDEKVSQDEELTSTLRSYGRWLNTLTPWQRQELRRAETSEDRMQLVALINGERKAKLEEYRSQQQELLKLVELELSKPDGRRPGDPPSSDRARLSDHDLDIMISVLDDDFASLVKLRPDRLSGKAAYNFQLLAVALRENVKSVGMEVAHDQPLPDETIENMIATIADSEVRLGIEKIHRDWKARGFVGFLKFKLDMAWWNEARRRYPKQKELREIASNLGGKALEDFERQMEQSPHEAYARLWIATQRGKFKMDRQELSDELSQLGIGGPSGYRPGPPSQRRSGGGGFGSRNGGGLPRPRFTGAGGRRIRPAIAEKPKASD